MTKARHTANLVDANGDIQTSHLDNVPNEVAVSSSAPGSPSEGDLWYDTTNEILKVYNTTDSAFVKVVRVVPTLDSISGNIINANATNLTLTGTGFLSSGLIVSFTPSGGSATNVTVTPTSDLAATVAVPSGIYGQSTDTVIGIKVTNSDNKASSTVNKTVVGLPTGGTISNSGGYRIHTFTSSGTFTNTIANLSVQYLVIAGGGGSGRQHGGGGGAGGYRCSVTGETSGGGASAESALTLSTGNKTVTVGAGGAGSTGEYIRGSSGTNSVFDTITSTGGGGGGSYQASVNSAGDGLSGGSGGGAGSIESTNTGSGYANSGGAGTSGQGYAGGNSAYAGAGGGGASQVGEDGSGGSPAGDAGNGGNGQTSSINGTSTGRAGGGAGGSYGGSNQSSGSRGIATSGGGNGGWGAESGTNGTANTGGGAGGGGVLANGASTGGSGIVIVRYQL
jgi:hypothetical protein